MEENYISDGVRLIPLRVLGHSGYSQGTPQGNILTIGQATVSLGCERQQSRGSMSVTPTP